MNDRRFDYVLAMEKFRERKAANAKKKRIRNERLPAGSPMYYYCRHCGVHTETLPETHWSAPNTCCEACRTLVDHGLLPEAK